MPDVMMVRGYGFPKGTRMDYAGYGAYGAAPVESGLFAKVPQLDGYSAIRVPYSPLGDMVLPEMDMSIKRTSPFVLAAGAFAIWALFLRK